MDKKEEKKKESKDDSADLENEFILRLPEAPAKELHEALQSGSLRDRLTIRLDSELRYGELRFDHWLLHAKIVDLPTVIECLKTIDSKNFYKSADICQLMICKEEADALDSEKDSPIKGKKKDPNKVDKKFLWPHGITPPCKNVRKRRFRKTLKKKNIEAPEIEKEVKRLLRVDNDAVKVDYEIINEDIDRQLGESQSKDDSIGDEDFNNDTMNECDKTNDDTSQKDINVESDGYDEDPASNSAPIGGVGEHDIFGEEVSSSDDEPTMPDQEDTSRLTADDSRLSDFSMSTSNAGASTCSTSRKDNTKPSLEFNKSMFSSPKQDLEELTSKFGGSSSNLTAPSSAFESRKTGAYYDEASNDSRSMAEAKMTIKLYDIQRQYDELKIQHSQKSQEIASIQNPTLKQRMQETVDNLQNQIKEKEMEIKKLETQIGDRPDDSK